MLADEDDWSEPNTYKVFGPKPDKPGALNVTAELCAELEVGLQYEDLDKATVESTIAAGGDRMLNDLIASVMRQLESEGLDPSELPQNMIFNDGSKIKLYLGEKNVSAPALATYWMRAPMPTAT